MSVVFVDDWLTVHHGDARSVLPMIEAESIDAVVTSPPYWRQRSYLADDDPLKPLELGSEPTFAEWVDNLLVVCRELRRVLKPEGSLWMVLGDRFVAYGGQRQGKNAGKREYLRDVPLDRPGIDGYPSGLTEKSLVLAPYRLAIALCDDGWILRDRVVWAKTNALPESVGDRLSVRDEVVFRLTTNPDAYFNLAAVRQAYSPATIQRLQPHRALSFSGEKSHAPGQPPQTPRGPRFGGDKGAPAGVTRISGREWKLGAGKNPGNVWSIATSARANEGRRYKHSAMFPAQLVVRPILATVPKGGVVLDPFAGTGTVAEVANEHLRRAVLIELDPVSIEHIRIRTQRRSIAEVPA